MLVVIYLYHLTLFTRLGWPELSVHRSWRWCSRTCLQWDGTLWTSFWILIIETYLSARYGRLFKCIYRFFFLLLVYTHLHYGYFPLTKINFLNVQWYITILKPICSILRQWGPFSLFAICRTLTVSWRSLTVKRVDTQGLTAHYVSYMIFNFSVLFYSCCVFFNSVYSHTSSLFPMPLKSDLGLLL